MHIPTIIHWSTVLVLVLFAIFNPSQALWLLIAYLSVIPHEYGHCAAARYFGIKTKQIIMYPVGGMAMLERMPKEPIRELIVAAAGPAVTVVLTIIGFIGLVVSQWGVEDGAAWIHSPGFFGRLFIINLGLLIFNMIPAFPMDGGRIFRAILGWFTSYVKATWWAARVGQGICFGLGFLGFISMSPSLIIVPMLIGMFAEKELAHVIMMDKREKALAEKKAKETEAEVVEVENAEEDHVP